jgi:hypothetical protein
VAEIVIGGARLATPAKVALTDAGWHLPGVAVEFCAVGPSPVAPVATPDVFMALTDSWTFDEMERVATWDRREPSGIWR